jgi:hypothetical protein
MKTTVEISDAIFERAKRLAASRGSTMRAIIEEGLLAVLSEHKKSAVPFRLRDASVRGDGLEPGVSLSDWNQIRALIYEPSE